MVLNQTQQTQESVWLFLSATFPFIYFIITQLDLFSLSAFKRVLFSWSLSWRLHRESWSYFYSDVIPTWIFIYFESLHSSFLLLSCMVSSFKHVHKLAAACQRIPAAVFSWAVIAVWRKAQWHQRRIYLVGSKPSFVLASFHASSASQLSPPPAPGSAPSGMISWECVLQIKTLRAGHQSFVSTETSHKNTTHPFYLGNTWIFISIMSIKAWTVKNTSSDDHMIIGKMKTK